MTSVHDRRGMTLVELLVVTILGGIVLLAIYQLLITNQRTYAAQNAVVTNQQSLRAGMDVLASEIREISPSDGDLISMGSQSLTIRANRSVGLFCNWVTIGADPIVQARAVGRYLRGDSARVFFENDPSRMADDVWRTARVVVVDTTGTLSCPTGGTAQSVQLEGVDFGSVAATDSITPGGLIRNFNHFSYELGTYDGDPFLIREDEDGVVAPLIGPLRAGDGVGFRYLDSDGNVTGTTTAVRQVEVTIRTSTDFRDNSGSIMEDSLTVRIHTRGGS